MENTQWLPIPGFEGRYEASDTGLIRSLLRREPHVLSGTLTGRPEGWVRYRQVHIWDNAGVLQHPYVHRLVLLAFVGPRPDGQEGRHLNGNSLDNRLANLAYGTHGENIRDSAGHGTHNMKRKTECINGHEFTEENTRTIFRRGGYERVCRACARERTNRRR